MSFNGVFGLKPRYFDWPGSYLCKKKIVLNLFLIPIRWTIPQTLNPKLNHADNFHGV